MPTINYSKLYKEEYAYEDMTKGYTNHALNNECKSLLLGLQYIQYPLILIAHKWPLWLL
jgi:hypothetical protein